MRFIGLKIDFFSLLFLWDYKDGNFMSLCDWKIEIDVVIDLLCCVSLTWVVCRNADLLWVF